MGSIFVSFMHIFFWEIINIFFSIFVMIHTDLAWNGNYRFLSFFIICLVCHLVFPLFYCKWMLFWIILFVTDFNISYLRQAGRQTSRYTDRQTDRQRKTERQRQRETERNDCHPTWTHTISAKSNLLMKNYSCIHWYSGRLVTPVRHYYWRQVI